MDDRSNKLLEETEIQLILEAVFRCYGFDFREYAIPLLKPRIWEQIDTQGLKTISGLQERILHDPDSMEQFVLALSPRPSRMFEEPGFYVAFKAKVVPLLRTYPSFQVWVPACGTGEELYALAITLAEEDLLGRCRIYATDLSALLLQKAKGGVFSRVAMDCDAVLYREAGGKGAFTDYYTTAGDMAEIVPSLKANVIFSEHNLATDASFNEFHFILCRSTMSSFNDVLQERVQGLFFKSLGRFGILGLGRYDLLRFGASSYEELDRDAKLYRKVK